LGAGVTGGASSGAASREGACAGGAAGAGGWRRERICSCCALIFTEGMSSAFEIGWTGGLVGRRATPPSSSTSMACVRVARLWAGALDAFTAAETGSPETIAEAARARFSTAAERKSVARG